MSLTNSPFWMASTGAGASLYDYPINYSLRLSDISGSYLYQTEDFATNNTWTFSCWIKRNLMKDQASSSDQQILHVNNNDPWEAFRWVGADDSLAFSSYGRGGGTYAVNIYTYPIFRDPSSWYHVMFVYDAGNGTAADRQRIYVNGERMSVEGGRYGSGTGSSNTSTTSNSALGAGYNISIGSRDGNNPDADFQIAEVHFLDGYALTPSSFGETKEDIWVPKEYTGSYGQGGSYLDFADSSDLGKDVSGQGNHWSSGSAISAHDQLTDTPTNNFCTLNPLTCGTYPVLIDGNLRISTMYSADLSGCSSTWAVDSGKWYWEIHMEGSTLTYPYIGITDPRQIMGGGGTKGTFYSLAWRRNGTAVDVGTTYMGTITKENSESWTNDDIIMFALDAGARKLWIGKNGTWNDSGDPAAGTGENASWTITVPVSPSIMGYQSQGVGCVFNFGQDGTFADNQTAQGNSDDNGIGDFYYSPPSGFLAMATPNLTADIDPASGDKPSNYFDTMLYTAATADGTYTYGNLSFQPDFSWIKNRNNVERHFLIDVVRGNTSVTNKFLVPNATSTEGSNGVNGTTFSVTSDGYQFVESSINSGELFFNGRTYVGWNWLAGGTAVSNTDGTATSQVSANTDAGFSIVSWTQSSGATFGHGLSQIPELFIHKRRTATSQWPVYTTATGSKRGLELNSTGASFDASAVVWDATTFTNFTGDSGDWISYCFHSVEGFSKVGKYRGFSSSNGAYVHCGFRPAWVLIKSTSSGTDWCIFDNKRLGYNVDNNLQRVVASSEQTDDDIDFLAHGFKLRRSSSNFNNTSHDYIFLAFAEQPFKYANAR